MNGSVQWIDAPHSAPQAGSFCQVATWTENTFVYLSVPYSTAILPNVSTIRRRVIEDVPVNPHTLALQAKREIHAQILQDICDRSDASSYDDGWIKESDS